MAGEDWRVVKAMCFQESRFKPMAISPVGAQGVCQLMPDTFSFIVERIGMNGADVFEPKDNIFAGVAYLAWIKNQWSSKRTNWQRMELTFASYNAGIGNVLKAQKKCNNSLVWAVIQHCMVEVTGINNSKETLDYVNKIENWYSEIKSCKPIGNQNFTIHTIIQFIGKFYNGNYDMATWRRQGNVESLPSLQHQQQGFVRFYYRIVESMYTNAWNKYDPNANFRGKVFIASQECLIQTNPTRGTDI